MKKTKIEIIDETAAFYNLSNRSVSQKNPYRCMYDDGNGHQCAFARLVQNPEELKSLEGKTALSILRGEKQNIIIIKEEYSGYEPSFYCHIQMLHDNPNYWTEKGLSKEGEEFVKQLKRHHKD